jgi:transposase InsO family protein
VLAIASSAEYRDKSPNQIVPGLADKGLYVASESSFYRVLREESLDEHRGRQQPRTSKAPQEFCATGPGQVLSWDITYLRAPVFGMFFYLYLYLDVWSRKIVGFRVEDRECGELASGLLREVCQREGLDEGTVVHQDNGGPMKGATFKATMDMLGVTASFSRPRVSDDNPFSESAYRTLKYHPSYPRGAFESIEAAREWVAAFVAWYNHDHLHSGIGFVSPADRHAGLSDTILTQRKAVYEAAKRRNPARWSGDTRAWKADADVFLNPTKETRLERKGNAVAA